jgi:hypothetical protein
MILMSFWNKIRNGEFLYVVTTSGNVIWLLSFVTQNSQSVLV